MRILRYAARMGFKMESRTQEWFELAIERGLHENLEGADVGNEVRSLARDDNPSATLKQWEARGLLASIHPQLLRRKPDYDSLSKLARVRGNLMGAGLRPRLHSAVAYYILSRLKSREAAAALRHLEFRAAEIDAINSLVPGGQKIVKMLKGRKTNAPKDAYFYIASLPTEMLAFIEVEMPNPRALSKVRNYIQKWRPLRLALPAAELDALGIARGPRFDKILEQLFEAQLRGKARDPESRTKVLRQLAGIKEEPKKKPEKEKKVRKGKAEAAPEAKPLEMGKPQAAAAAPPGPAQPQGKAKSEKPGAGKPPAAPAAPAAAAGKAKPTAAPAKAAAPAAKSHASRPAHKPAARGAKKSRRR
jgi:tRNA nucleotidyltransferase/poly(A) polymerase